MYEELVIKNRDNRNNLEETKSDNHDANDKKESTESTRDPTWFFPGYTALLLSGPTAPPQHRLRFFETSQPIIVEDEKENG